MSDITKLNAGKGPAPGSNQLRAQVSDVEISVDGGEPVTGDGSGGIIFAKGNDDTTANVTGLAATAGENPGSVNVQFAGPLTLSTARWDHVTGQSGGLTPKAIYYLSAATQGKLTTTPPSNPNYITPVGFALSEDTMMIQIGAAVQASP